jgi:tetratricopeptide (TPR) repeat protein
VLDLTASVLAQTGSIEEIHYWRGRALAAQGDIAGAQASFSQALALNPDFAPAQDALRQ